MVQALQKTVQQFLEKINIELSYDYDPSVIFLDVYEK